VALAAALGAERCEIFTDVEGVFTADPRIVPGARKLHAVSYEEMLELAASGAKVLQLRCVEFARNHGVTLHVRSTFADEEGTWIGEEDERMLEKAMIAGVTHDVEEAVFEVESADPAELFQALADASVNVDTVIQIGTGVVFSAPEEDRDAATGALERLGARWTEREGLGKVSVVGAGMKSHPGVAAKTFGTLAEIGVDSHFVSTSPIKIAFYVPRPDVERAVKALHEVFDLPGASAEREHA
jgi:aspartate kinase